jgi:hypothetical protein
MHFSTNENYISNINNLNKKNDKRINNVNFIKILENIDLNIKNFGKMIDNNKKYKKTSNCLPKKKGIGRSSVKKNKIIVL